MCDQVFQTIIENVNQIAKVDVLSILRIITIVFNKYLILFYFDQNKLFHDVSAVSAREKKNCNLI